MSSRFFQLADDLSVASRWHLATPVDSHGHKVHDWDFIKGTPIHIEGRLKLPIRIAGRPLDFSWALVSVPVIHIKIASVLTSRAPDDVQLIPADIEGQPGQYLVLVAKRLVRCIDEEASKVRFWTPEHGVPDKVGQYMGVDRLRLDKRKVGGAEVFRPEGWEVALIVSEDIKNALEDLRVTGARFEEV